MCPFSFPFLSFPKSFFILSKGTHTHTHTLHQNCGGPRTQLRNWKGGWLNFLLFALFSSPCTDACSGLTTAAHTHTHAACDHVLADISAALDLLCTPHAYTACDHIFTNISAVLDFLSTRHVTTYLLTSLLFWIRFACRMHTRHVTTYLQTFHKTLHNPPRPLALFSKRGGRGTSKNLILSNPEQSP